MFGEEPGETNEEWKGEQEGKGRLKSEEPLNRFPDGFSNVGSQ